MDFGLRGLALKWMTSYLKNRSQFVSLSGPNSSIKHMLYGVPQGSILGLLLFIICINDLQNIFNRAQFILYADDANIIINSENIADIVQQLNALCNILPNWLIRNGLAMNLKKTKYMLFNRQNIELPDKFEIQNKKIGRVKKVRFLGVIKLVCSYQNFENQNVTLYRYSVSFLPIHAKMQISKV